MNHDAVTGLYNYGARYYDPGLSIWMGVDPLADHPNQVHLSPYNYTWNNPVNLTDPDGRCPDCPNGEYKIQKGDTFWDLEDQWNMERGSLSSMNQNVDPTKLQIGQTIRTTLNQSDLPSGIKLHSPNSMKGMDGFFKKGAEGVNRIVNLDPLEYDNDVRVLAHKSKGGIKENATGGALDAKMYFLNDQSTYANNTKKWFRERTSVDEPATRSLYVYRGYAYNLNEVGNLMFGSAKAYKNVNLRLLIGGGHLYSLWANRSMDEASEVEAVKRGYGYYR